MEQSLKYGNTGDSVVVGFMTSRIFIDEGLIFLDDFEQTLLSLERKRDDVLLLRWLATAMAGFVDGAAMHNMDEVVHLADGVTRVLTSKIDNKCQLSDHTFYLVHAALSQLRQLLAPSLNGTGDNAVRIVTGLMHMV